MATQKTAKSRASGTGSPTGPEKAEQLFNEIKEALHQGADKQWLLPPEVNKEECVVPSAVE